MPGKLLITLFVCCTYIAGAQARRMDSLLNVFRTSADDKQKIDAIAGLANHGYDPDSLLPLIQQGDRIASSLKDEHAYNQLMAARSVYYVKKNNADSSLMLIDILIERTKNKGGAEYLNYLFFKAKLLDRAGRYTMALKQLSDVVEESEIVKDTLIEIQAKTGIGWVQMEMGQYKEALQWFYKALHTSNNKQFYNNYGALYSNIASSYNSLHQTDSAKFYIAVAIADARANDNLGFLSTALSMQARIFIDAGEAHLAEKPLHEVLDIRKQMNDPYYIVYDMSNLASYYAANNQPEKGIALCKEGIIIAKKEGLTSQLLMLYDALAKNYKALGDNKSYGQTLEQVIALKDSFNNINSSKQLAELQASYEAQRNEKTIIEQKLSLTRKNYWLYGSAIFGLMAAIIAWLGFNFYKRRQQLRTQQAVQQEKINAAIAVVEAEEQERKRIAADLHDNLGVYAASMVSNLSYVKVHELDDATQQAFEELKNNSNAIISQLNDTIWVLKKDNLTLTAISDRIKTFIKRVQKSYPGIQIEVAEDIKEDRSLLSSQAFHLYRIIQEGINNALKHSKGSHIIVHITSDDNWKVMIEDNGIGLTVAVNNDPLRLGGNGIHNMKQRSKEAGWDIEWRPSMVQGAIVTIVPTTN